MTLWFHKAKYHLFVYSFPKSGFISFSIHINKPIMVGPNAWGCRKTNKIANNFSKKIIK